MHEDAYCSIVFQNYLCVLSNLCRHVIKKKKASNTEKLIMGSTASNSAPFCPSLVSRGNPFEAFLVLYL